MKVFKAICLTVSLTISGFSGIKSAQANPPLVALGVGLAVTFTSLGAAFLGDTCDTTARKVGESSLNICERTLDSSEYSFYVVDSTRPNSIQSFKTRESAEMYAMNLHRKRIKDYKSYRESLAQ